MGMTEPERDVLNHLANDWDAQAAEIERRGFTAELPSHKYRAEALRECAGQLRDQLLQLRAPVPHVIRDATMISWGPVFDAPWPPSADLTEIPDREPGESGPGQRTRR